MVSDQDDRAQLILIGAIAVALLVIGMALVVNAVLYTENVRSSESSVQLSDSEDIGYEIRRSVRTLTLQVNHRTRYHTSDEISKWVGNNVTGLSHLLGESHVSSGPMAVNVTYTSTGSNGSRLVQAADGEFVSGDDPNDGDWQPIGGGSDQRLGWGVVNLNMSRTSDERFQLHFEDDEGETVSMTFNKTYNPREMDVETTINSNTASATCTPRNRRVLLDLHEGRSYTDDSCTFNGSAELGNVTAVRIENGDNAIGKYSFVTKEENFNRVDPSCEAARTPAVEPCITPVVWQADVTVGISGDGFDYEKPHNITVYGGGS